MEVVYAGQEVAEVTAGGAHDRCVAETSRVPDERSSELGEKLVGGASSVAQRRRAGVGDRRQDVIRVAAVDLEDAVCRQPGRHEHAPPRVVPVPLADHQLDTFQQDSVHRARFSFVDLQLRVAFPTVKFNR